MKLVLIEVAIENQQKSRDETNSSECEQQRKSALLQRVCFPCKVNKNCVYFVICTSHLLVWSLGTSSVYRYAASLGLSADAIYDDLSIALLGSSRSIKKTCMENEKRCAVELVTVCCWCSRWGAYDLAAKHDFELTTLSALRMSLIEAAPSETPKKTKQRRGKQSTINTLPIYRHDRLFVPYYWYNIYPLFRVWLGSTPFGHDGHNNCIYSWISEFFGLDACQCHEWYTFFCTQSQCACVRCLMCLLVFHQLLNYRSKMSGKRPLLLDYI